jgi:hypothetical protein
MLIGSTGVDSVDCGWPLKPPICVTDMPGGGRLEDDCSATLRLPE